MPGTDGLEATRRIRREIGDRLPILALTAHACVEDEDRCRDAGMDAYLTKPISLDALRDSLECWAVPGRVGPS
jgi:CheY-like chemotaxis protein